MEQSSNQKSAKNKPRYSRFFNNWEVAVKSNNYWLFGIREDNKMYIFWSSAVNLCYIVSFVLIPLVVASNLRLIADFCWFELTLDLIMLCDILVSCFKSYKTDIRVVRDVRFTAIRYLTGGFVIEFLGVFPWLLTTLI